MDRPEVWIQLIELTVSNFDIKSLNCNFNIIYRHFNRDEWSLNQCHKIKFNDKKCKQLSQKCWEGLNIYWTYIDILMNALWIKSIYSMLLGIYLCSLHSGCLFIPEIIISSRHYECKASSILDRIKHVHTETTKIGCAC